MYGSSFVASSVNLGEVREIIIIIAVPVDLCHCRVMWSFYCVDSFSLLGENVSFNFFSAFLRLYFDISVSQLKKKTERKCVTKYTEPEKYLINVDSQKENPSLNFNS